MKYIKKKIRGSFLADVMVAMGILTMTITSSLALVSQSVKTNSANKNKIIAVSLAKEGIEGVRLIRDTNWLRYGSNKRLCWNFWSNTNEDSSWDNIQDESCTNSDKSPNEDFNQHPIGLAGNDADVRIKNYLLHLDKTNYDWVLVENFGVIPESGDVKNQIDTYKLSGDNTHQNFTHGDSLSKWEERKSKTNDLTSRLYLDSQTHLYTHEPGEINNINGERNTETDFYREIIIEYPLGDDNFYPNDENNNENRYKDNQILVTSRVWYRGHNGKMKKIEIETEITDYLERTNWLE